MLGLSRRALLVASTLPVTLPILAAAEAAPLRVVASFSILADLVHQVGGPAVQVTPLVPVGGDPHTFEPRPSDLVQLKAASVMVENGLGLEGWLSRLVQSSGFRGVRIVASEGVRPRLIQEGGRGAPDPHIWQDPRLAVRMVQNIASGLAKADPGRAAEYKSRADAYAATVQRVDAEIASGFALIPEGRRVVVTTHDAFGYYGARYGIAFHAPLGISTETEPSPRALAQLATQMRRLGVRTVFLETMTDPRLAETLAREAGVVVGPAVYSDTLSPPGGPAPAYLELLRYNTAQFLAAMRG